MSEPLHVYVAGPYRPTAKQRALIAAYPEHEQSAVRRTYVEDNIARAVALGVKVAKLGAYPVVPHANTAHPDYELVQPDDFWLKGTAGQLKRSDAIIFTDDWQESSGSRGENEIAIDSGIPRFFTLSDLACWLSPALAAATGSLAPTLATTNPPPAAVHPTLDELVQQIEDGAAPVSVLGPLSFDDVDVCLNGQTLKEVPHDWTGEDVEFDGPRSPRLVPINE